VENITGSHCEKRIFLQGTGTALWDGYIIWRLKDEAEELVAKGETENAKIWEREEALCQDLRAEVDKLQVLDRGTVKTREETQILGEGHKKAQEDDLLTKARTENVNKDSVFEDQRDADITVSLNVKVDSYDSTSKENQMKIALMREEIAKKKESRDKAWHHNIRIQQAEGHPPRLPPTESNTPPVFDIAQLQAQSVATETKAAADEVIAKAELNVTVTSLELDVAKGRGEELKTNVTPTSRSSITRYCKIII
jgi:hypothetical protein